jgi:hypothetical protein
MRRVFTLAVLLVLGNALPNLEKEADLTKPNTVRAWMIGKLGTNPPELTSLDVILDLPQGPHPAGSVIGLCRMRGCRIAAIDMCDDRHVHDLDEGVTIDEQGPYPEPTPPCAYGKVAVHPAPGP